MISTTQPLVHEQQLFLQRLFAAHVMSDADAEALSQELGIPERKQAFREINAQLTIGFGLEIATVVVGGNQYHAVINTHGDDVAKSSFEHHFSPHEMALIRLILEHLVQKVDRAPRKDLINLRGELKDPYKLTLPQAEQVVARLWEECWLVPVDETSHSRQSFQLEFQLAPRAYLELSHLLQEMGIPQEEMPQFLFHRL